MAPQVPQQGGPPATAPAPASAPTSAPATPAHRRGRSARGSNPEEAKTQLAARRIRPGETLAELAEDLLRLTRTAYPRMDGASQDELARDRLLVEVEDPAARRRARQAQPPSLATALRELTGCDPAPAPAHDPPAASDTAAAAPCASCGAEDGLLAAAVRDNTEAVLQLVEKMSKREEAEASGSSWTWGWRLFW